MFKTSKSVIKLSLYQHAIKRLNSLSVPKEISNEEYFQKLEEIGLNSLKLKHEKLTETNQHEILNRNMHPFMDIPYEKQLEYKTFMFKKSLHGIKKTLEYDRMLNEGMRNHVDKYDYLFPVIRDIQPMKHIEDIHSKYQLNIGKDINGNDKCVGHTFKTEKISDDETIVHERTIISLDKLKFVPERFKLVANHFQQFLRSNTLKTRDGLSHFNKSWHWNDGHVYKNTLDQIMFQISMHPQSLKRDQIDFYEKQALDYFFEGPGKECNIDCLYFFLLPVSYESIPNNKLFEFINGNVKYLVENDIYYLPTSSFPSNFEAHKETNQVVFEIIKNNWIDNIDVVLDINCTNGEIALLSKDYFKKVCAFQTYSFQNANIRFNLEQKGSKADSIDLNRIKNITLHLKNIIRDFGKSVKIGAVYSDNGADLFRKEDRKQLGYALKDIRRIGQVKEIIYITDKPFKDIFQLNTHSFLCGKREKKHFKDEEPFLPVQAIPFDSKPHTMRFKAILHYKRD